MLSKKEVEKIREHLNNAQNPIFFFDNDADGLCSFLLLQRYIGRGKGIPIKSFPEMTRDYFRRVVELNADYIFILDKPSVSKEFFSEVEKINLPVVWIDHHNPKDSSSEIPRYVDYYNSYSWLKKFGVPVTALCFQISDKKNDLWLAIAGCISDRFFPPKEYKQFMTDFPELGIDSKDAFEIYYRSDIGKISRILGASLKDRTTLVVSMIKYLMNAKGPYDVLEENSKNYFMHKRFEFISNSFKKIIKDAMNKKIEFKNFLYFEYAGENSMSADVSNYLSFLFPLKDIIVVYINGAKANLSCRGKKIRKKMLKLVKGIEGANVGGHEDAVGGQMPIDLLTLFKERVLK
jgi:hypothetical protein